MSDWYTFLPHGALQWEESLKAIIFFGSGFVEVGFAGMGWGLPVLIFQVSGL